MNTQDTWNVPGSLKERWPVTRLHRRVVLGP